MTLSFKTRTTKKSSINWPASSIQYKVGESSPWTVVPIKAGTIITHWENQVTGSESHKRLNGAYRSGGPFYTSRYGERMDIRLSSGDYSFGPPKEKKEFHSVWNDLPVLYPASVLLAFSKETVPELSSSDFSELDRYGTEAISLCSPANPASEVGTGASELLHEGIPSLPGIHTWQDRTNLAKAAGDEYLNYQFGWDPLVTEVKSFASVAQRHRDILNQYSRNAGTNVRRQFRFPIDNSSSSSSFEGGNIWPLGEGATQFETFGNTGKNTVVTKTSGTRTRRWFSGSFTYQVPSQSDSWKRMLGYGSDADILFGASLNPELLWSLTPWSWAVDWFSDAGDVINNISNYVRAGQVMRYGFVMEEVESFIRYSVSLPRWEAYGVPGDLEKFRITKRRTIANPFGFGLKEPELSPIQLAITAALGLTLL